MHLVNMSPSWDRKNVIGSSVLLTEAAGKGDPAKMGQLSLNLTELTELIHPLES